MKLFIDTVQTHLSQQLILVRWDELSTHSASRHVKTNWH